MIGYREAIDKALELREAGEKTGAVAILLEIVDSIPVADLEAVVVTGSLLREGREFPKALQCFQKVLDADPFSERGSLGLFHTLWNSGRHDEGFQELERFLSISESEAHFQLIQEMKEALNSKAKIK